MIDKMNIRPKTQHDFFYDIKYSFAENWIERNRWLLTLCILMLYVILILNFKKIFLLISSFILLLIYSMGFFERSIARKLI